MCDHIIVVSSPNSNVGYRYLDSILVQFLTLKARFSNSCNLFCPLLICTIIKIVNLDIPLTIYMEVNVEYA